MLKSTNLFFRFCLLFFSIQAYADYALGTGDVVRVTVYGDAELIREVRVSDEGILTFPLVGEVNVNGMTTSQAEKTIAGKLKGGGFISSPQVSVLVLQYLSKSVSVLGNVYKPGRYPITRPTQIKDVLAEAGGIGPDGSENIIFVKNGVKQELRLSEILNNQSHELDVDLTGGETIFVGSRDVAVTGQLLRPGKYALQSGQRKITDFIASAGGVSELASETLFYTTSQTGQPTSIEINIEEIFKNPLSDSNKYVSSGDVLYVPIAPQVYVYGEVQRPGMYKIDKNMTVMHAIAKAGGLTVRGTERSVKLFRKNTSDSTVKSKPDLTDKLIDADVLFIEERLF